MTGNINNWFFSISLYMSISSALEKHTEEIIGEYIFSEYWMYNPKEYKFWSSNFTSLEQQVQQGVGGRVLPQ